MIRTKIFEWITKTFGEFHDKMLVNYVEKNWLIEKKGQKFKILEINLALQIKIYNENFVNKDNFKFWKKQLDEITENSVKRYHCDDSNICLIDKDTIREGKSFLLTIDIHHKKEI